MNKYRFRLIIVILIALALRLYNLTYHSLWFDEAISVHWAKQSLPRILEVGFTLVEDRLPPLYYLTLKGWATLFGLSEVGVRSLSVVFGVLLVPVVAAIAAALFNRRIALITALLLALNPFLIWYAQEARMYAPAVFFSALTVWAFLRLCKAARGKGARGKFASLQGAGSTARLEGWHYVVGFFLLFILAAAAGLYTHLYTGFLLPALGVWLIVSYPRAWRLWLLFALGGLVITLAFAPLAIATWRFSGEAPPGDPFSGILGRVWWLLQAFTIWKAPVSVVLQFAIPTVVIFFAIAAYFKPKIKNRTSNTESQPAALRFSGPTQASSPAPPSHSTSWPGKTSTQEIESPLSSPSSLSSAPSPLPPPPSPLSSLPSPLLLISLLLILPFAIANALLFRNHLAFFGQRYFIVMVPWLLLLAAVGVDNVSRWLRWRIGTGHATNRQGAARAGQRHSRLSQSAAEGSATSKAVSSSLKDHPIGRTFHYSHLLSYIPLVLLLIAAVLPIPGQWSIPAAKEAWRQSVTYMAAAVRPADGILIHPDWVRFPFQFYFEGPGQTYAAFSDITPATTLDGPLQGVVGDHPVVWLIQSHLGGPDPERRVEQWFAARYPLVTELYPPGIAVKGYATDYQLSTLPPEAVPADIRFENGMQLIGYQTDQTASAADQLFHPPSGWVHVILYWTAAQPITAEARPVIQIVGPEGVWGESLERPDDALQLYPPWQWPAGPEEKVIIRHDLDVNLNPETPPGRYQLLVGLQGDEARYPLAEVEVR